MTFPYVHIYNFLDPWDFHNILQYSIAHQSEFTPTTTSTGKPDYRRSKVLHNPPDDFVAMVREREAVLWTAAKTLGVAKFPIARFEAQITASNDGDFYKVHNDSGSQEAAERVLTFVYYYHLEPKRFEGGELRFGDELIEPISNSIIFFKSDRLHEVFPVRSTGVWEDSRFTLNGWLRK